MIFYRRAGPLCFLSGAASAVTAAAMGLLGSFKLNRDLFTAQKVEAIAVSGPTTRFLNCSWRPTRSILSAIVTCWNGIPDQSDATTAIPLGPTTIGSLSSDIEGKKGFKKDSATIFHARSTITTFRFTSRDRLMHGTNSLNLLPVIDTGIAAAAGDDRCGGGDGGGVSPPAASRRRRSRAAKFLLSIFFCILLCFN